MKGTKPMSLYDGEEKILLEFVGIIDNDPEVDGEYEKSADGQPPTIRIAATRTHFSIVWAILHELLHRWEDAACKNMNHAELDEMARYLARVLTNSPCLLEYIKGATPKKRGK